MTVAEAVRLATARLTAAGIIGAARDARRLVAHAVGVRPDRLLLHGDDPVSAEAGAWLEGALDDRAARRPVAQITGERLFYGRTFRVTSDTLDPRPETEILVAQALCEGFSSVLDLGTGTGAIGVTLAAETGARGVLTDLSPDALQVARENAARHGADVSFVLSDWFSAVDGIFDLIVSNPPYIAAAEMAGLSPDVRLWEPEMALTPGGDGLAPYRAIAAGALAHLTDGGRLIVEIGPTQGADVSAMFRAAGLVEISVHPDLDGRDRIVCARRAKKNENMPN